LIGAENGHDAAGFVLAGGQSSRMGEDKALIRLANEPLVARALGILREAGLDASIAGARSSLDAFAPVVQDSHPDRGPLAGICAALASTSARYAVFLPVDLPLLPASLVRFLLHHARVVGGAVTVPSVSGFAQTFPAVVDRSTLPALETALKEGHGGCFSAFKDAAAQTGGRFSVPAVEMLVQSGQVNHPKDLPAVFWFKNVNTPEDLERAEFILANLHRVS
jgi:molybdopterin-guanine dinucleotide biosynthesis protein A